MPVLTKMSQVELMNFFFVAVCVYVIVLAHGMLSHPHTYTGRLLENSECSGGGGGGGFWLLYVFCDVKVISKTGHRKEAEQILPPTGFELGTFWSEVRRSHHSAIPSP